MKKAPHYQPGNKKRYACPTCNRRFATWASIFQHTDVLHAAVPSLAECDLVLRAERKRLLAEGCPEADLPVTMPGRSEPAADDAEEMS